MDFSDEGILISAKPLGEANTIAELLTARHGRHLGLVRGGRSRKMRPLMQLGNRLSVTWRARLADHLGGFNVELLDPNAARVLDDQAALAAIGSLTGLAKLLPERDPHPQLYHGALEVLAALDDASLWPALLVRWEMMLLQDLGFGLDLSECAATGTDADLIYVSPKSGRAVSRDAGQPYCDRLLKLPALPAGGGPGTVTGRCPRRLRADRPLPRARRAEPPGPRTAAGKRTPVTLAGA